MKAALSRWRTLLVVHVGMTVLALTMVLPLGLFGDELLSHRPEGDLDLWRKGGAIVVDLISGHVAALGAVLKLVFVALLVSVALSPIGTAAICDAISHGRDVRGARYGELVASCWGKLAVQRLAHFAVLLMLLLGAVAIGNLTYKLADGWPSLTSRIGLQVAAIAPLGVLALILSGAADVAQARTVGGSALGPVRTYIQAARWAVRFPMSVLGPYLFWLLIAAALSLFGAEAATALGGRPGRAALALVVLHQVIAAGRTFLRAAWLSRAVRLGSLLEQQRSASLQRDRRGANLRPMLDQQGGRDLGSPGSVTE